MLHVTYKCTSAWALTEEWVPLEAGASDVVQCAAIGDSELERASVIRQARVG